MWKFTYNSIYNKDKIGNNFVFISTTLFNRQTCLSYVQKVHQLSIKNLRCDGLMIRVSLILLFFMHIMKVRTWFMTKITFLFSISLVATSGFTSVIIPKLSVKEAIVVEKTCRLQSWWFFTVFSLDVMTKATRLQRWGGGEFG